MAKLAINGHPCQLLITGGSGSRKTSALLCFTKQQDADDHSIIDQSYLYVKGPIEAKY